MVDSLKSYRLGTRKSNLVKEVSMHFVYIIYSQRFDRFYTGESVNPQERLLQHNQGFYQSSSTALTNDWRLLLVINVETRREALLVERYLKTMKSKKYLVNLINDPLFFEAFKTTVQTKFNIIIR